VSVPGAARDFFPLDEELQLVPGSVTPRAQEDLTHLATWMPFARAAQMLKRLQGIEVSEATVRRQTEHNGAAYVAVQEAEVARIEQEMPEAPAGPDKQLLSVDGAMVPLVGGEWAEVKTLVLGVIEEPVMEQGEQKVHARELSYFSRLAEAEVFTRLALVETHRRGVEKAGQVAAVTDGAEWEQGFIDYHRPDAVRILDFPHAGEYVSHIGTAVWGEGKPETQLWLKERLTWLKHKGPRKLLPELRALTASHPQIADLGSWLAYLEKREAHMQYPVYQEQGLPLGSGAAESGNKLVVEARLKGSGMHWARQHVNPMVGLRNAVCSDRWDEAWSQISAFRQRQAQQRRHIRREQRLAAAAASSDANRSIVDAAPLPTAPEPAAVPVACETDMAMPPLPRQPWRPPPDHLWRKYPACPSRRRTRPPDARK
jgi:hypothetical protein